MKQLVSALVYMLVSCITIVIVIAIVSNIKPINHTHDKKLEKALIDQVWIGEKYYNDELKEVLLRFNKDHTFDYYYTENKRPADIYYARCSTWMWTEQKRIIKIECENSKYSKSYIEVVSINKDTLRLKTYNENIELKRGK